MIGGEVQVEKNVGEKQFQNIGEIILYTQHNRNQKHISLSVAISQTRMYKGEAFTSQDYSKVVLHKLTAESMAL